MARYIDADALKLSLQESIISKHKSGFALIDYDFIALLDDAETADVQEVKHGNWRYCGSDRYNDAFACSNCGHMAMDDSPYSSHCGAKMDGEQ